MAFNTIMKGFIYLILSSSFVLSPATVVADHDADGLSDNYEFCNGSYSGSNNTGTCSDHVPPTVPLDSMCGLHPPCVSANDYDDDKLHDGIERNWNNNSGPYISDNDTGTNPLVADTDSDGLNDNIERCTGDFDGFDDTGTCPTDTSCAQHPICDNANDFDNDGVLDGADNCPLIPNPDQANNDTDTEPEKGKLGDACDLDDDGDSIPDVADMCPLNKSAGVDADGNGVDDGCDLICFRTHIGVPGQDEPPSLTDSDVANDVGWRGAHRVSFNNGTDMTHVDFQVLRHKTDDLFYLAFEVENDLSNVSAGDTVVITFRPDFNIAATSFPAGNANNDIRIVIHPDATQTEVYKYSDSSWGSNIAGSVAGLDVQKIPGVNAWDIEVVMPTTITEGGDSWVDFSNYFKFYFNVIRDSNSVGTEAVWPGRGHAITGAAASYNYDNHEWGIGTQDSSAKCNGVYLTYSDIGNELGATSSKINLTNPNRLYANVKNLSWDSSSGASGDWVSATDINVRFRIADWGIAGVGDNASWREIPADIEDCSDGLDDENPTCNKDIGEADSSTTPGNTTFNLDWTVGYPFGENDPNPNQANYQAELDKYNTVSGYDHQCILVELDSTSGANITTKSVHRNMDIDLVASVFQRKAKISAVGLGKPPSGKAKHQFILQEIIQEYESVPISKGKQIFATATGLRDDVKGGYAEDRSDKDVWGSITTTRWLVHGYRETGNYVEIKGVKYPLAEVVSSFGYVVSHEGAEVESWDYDLAAIDGDTGLEKTAEGTYKISVPEDGFREINTRVEPKLTFWNRLIEYIMMHPIRIFLFLLFIVLLLWIIKRFRS